MKVDIGDGIVGVPTSTVDRIVKGKTPLDEYEERAGRLGPGDAKGWRGRGRWASQRGLSSQAREAYENVLTVSPDDAEAREALGFVQLDGRWVTEEESYRARGYVKYDGEWMTPAEVQVAQAEAAAFEADRRAAQAARSRPSRRSVAPRRPSSRRARGKPSGSRASPSTGEDRASARRTGLRPRIEASGRTDRPSFRREVAGERRGDGDRRGRARPDRVGHAGSRGRRGPDGRRNRGEALGRARRVVFHHNQDRTDAQQDKIVDDCRSIVKEKKSQLSCFALEPHMEISL